VGDPRNSSPVENIGSPLLLAFTWKYSQDQMTEVSNEIDYMQYGNS